MKEKRQNKFYLDNPIIVLNGLVTDKNQYSSEQTIQLLKKNKKVKGKKLKKENYIFINKNIDNNEQLDNEKIITLSEDSDSNGESKINSEIKSSKKINDNIKPKKLKNKNIISTDKKNPNIFDESIKNKKNEKNNKTNKNNKKENKKRIKPLLEVNDDDNHDNDDNDDNEEIIEIKNNIKDDSLSKGILSNGLKPLQIKYKNVEVSTDYNEIKKICKNNSCTYIPLFNSNDLKSVIELNSSILKLNKKIKNDGKENIIISEYNQEKNLINALNKLLFQKKDNKFELFQKLKPEYKNILNYLTCNYCGINNYGFMNINSFDNDNQIHFITSLFKDKTSQYVLKFRKYILNLSSFQSDSINNSYNEYFIYHIIIPKNNIKSLDINFNEKMSLNELLDKLNCEYYFYKQSPGELLIVEPGCIHLTYYKKTKKYEKYLLVFWNKMSIDLFSDYMFLKNDCIKEEYKYFPILTMLLNLINKKIKYLSDDYIKTILEIYNEMDTYENINKYIKDINDNNIFFHKLFLKNIDICNNCQQEIFNFYVYYNDNNIDFNIENKNNQFLCINCAYKKKFFSIPKSIIFYKYSKDEIKSFINKISAYINNKNKKEKKEKKEYIDIDNSDDDDEEEIISKTFDLNNRKDDCVNIDEFILKIDGPLEIIDKDYENNNNYLSYKNIKVYKDLIKLENDKINNIDPLNNLNENDIYEFSSFSFKPNLLFNNSDRKSDTEKKNKNINNLLSFNKKDNYVELNNNNLMLSKNDKDRNDIKRDYNINEKKQSKKKKKKETVSDLIKDGKF